MTAQLATAFSLKPAYRWDEEAACRLEEPALFVGTDTQPLTQRTAQFGKEICASCPVARDCLLDALLTHEQHGLRGGFLPAERNRELKRSITIEQAMRAYDEGRFAKKARRP